MVEQDRLTFPNRKRLRNPCQPTPAPAAQRRDRAWLEKKEKEGQAETAQPKAGQARQIDRTSSARQGEGEMPALK